MPSLMGKPRPIPGQISRSKRETGILSVLFGRRRKSAFRDALGCRSKIQYPRSLPTATYGHFVLVFLRLKTIALPCYMRPRDDGEPKLEKL